MQKYITSNLIMENSWIEKIKCLSDNGKNNYSEEFFGDIKVCCLDVSKHEYINGYNYEKGKYITIYTPRLWLLENDQIDRISHLISHELKNILSHSVNASLNSKLKVLVAGLGNRRISSDSLGPLTVEKINVTRHVEIIDNEVFKASGLCSVCAISCGVMGDTGIETVELLKAIVKQVRPNAVITIDALASRSSERLGATVQLSDAGISPGSGIGNRRCSVNFNTIGVPVIAIGVPMVISAATLVGDVLSRYNKINVDKELETLLNEGKNYFVAPKECDLVSEGASVVLARSIDKALGVI